MKYDYSIRLEKEPFKFSSGVILCESKIPVLKERHYCIIPFEFDGDAPKSFIKAYFYIQGGSVIKSNFKTWKLYIAKSAQKWYPHESVIEYLINRIGETLQLNMNRIKLVKINGQIRFLSEYFLDQENEKLIHGAEICGEYLQDNSFADEIANDKKSARELFTFQFIIDAINSVFHVSSKDLILELIKMIVFDAIVGNNDRHFYNWGVIDSIKKGENKPRFSPIYDSARGLLWNWSDSDISFYFRNIKAGYKKIENYIIKGCPRISIEGDPNINHFQLISYIWDKHHFCHETILNLVSLKNEEQVLNLYYDEFRHYFINERNSFVLLIIKERFKRLRKITSKNDQ